MPEVLTGLWIGWAVALAVGIPVVLVVLTEILGNLQRKGSAAAGPVRLLRDWVVPVAGILALLVFAVQSPAEQVWARVVATVLGFLLILLILSAFNVALFANAKAGSWRERIPSIFVDLARLALIVVGLAILFSWVWGADVGGLITALGVTSIVIGLALQNAVGGIISGLLLLFEQPFRIGDWLDTGSVRGRVVEVNWRAVHIDVGTGIQIVPNASLAGSSFTNLSRPTAIFHATTTVTFATDDPPHEVLDLLIATARSVPALAPEQAPTAHYLGSSTYSVTIPIVGPSAEVETIGLFLGWLWYAARRHGLALDGDLTDPATGADRLDWAMDVVAPALHLSTDDRETIRAAGRLERYGAGEIVQQSGAVPDAMRFVVEGRLQQAVAIPGGFVPFTTIEAGDHVGQGALTREQAFASATALEITIVLAIPVEAIDDLVRRRPSLAREVGESIEFRRQRAAEALATAGVVRGTIARR